MSQATRATLTGLKSKEVQQALGLAKPSARKISRPNLRSSFLPDFFLASEEKLVSSVRTAISLLECTARNDYMIVRDEVCFAKSYNLLYGYDETDASKACVVGGAHPNALIPAADLEDGKVDTLGNDGLASVSVCTALGLKPSSSLLPAQRDVCSLF